MIAKKVLPLRHDGVLFERASSLDVFDERERSEIRDCEIEMQRTKARHTRREENDAKTSVTNNNNNNNNT